MSGDLVCWPAYPFRPGPVPRATQASLQTRPRGVPFTLLDREGKRLWWFIPTADQIERLRQAVAVSDIRNPPRSEIYTQLSHQGISATDLEKLDVPAVLDLLPADGARVSPGRRNKARQADRSTASGPTTQPDVDWSGAVAQLKGNETLLRQIAAVFLSEAGGMVERVRLAITAGDGAELRCAAGALKEALEYFKAQRSYHLASRLESFGREGQLDHAAEVYRQLEEAVHQVARELTAFAGPDDLHPKPSKAT